MCNDYLYEINNGEITIKRYCGDGDNTFVVIPREIDGYPVSVIGSNCFKDNGFFIEEIVVPDCVKRIEKEAFAYAVCLNRLELSDNLIFIGSDFVAATSLEELNIPASVSLIERPESIELKINVDDNNPFYYSDGYGLYKKTEEGLILVAVNVKDERQEYALNEKCAAISENVFKNAEYIKKLGIGPEVSMIPEGALTYDGNKVNENKGVSEINLSEDNTHFHYENNCLYQKDEKGLVLLKYFKGKKYVLPENVIKAGIESFRNSDIEEIVITTPDTYISPDAFVGCNLTKCFIEGTGLIVFSEENPFIRENLYEGFGHNGDNKGFVYDFTLMDEHVLREFLTVGRLEILLARLKIGKKTDNNLKQKLEEKVIEKFDELLLTLSKEKRVDLLEQMSEAGFITKDNIDHIIDEMAKHEQKEATAWFMSYKNNNFGYDCDMFL